MKALSIFIILFVVGCGKTGTIGTKKHQFGERAQKVVWLQVAGLAEEHLALLKFKSKKPLDPVNFEDFTCFGKVWNFSLSEIRPSKDRNFLMQMTGSKNNRNTCEDFSRRPIWDYLDSVKMSTGIYESEANFETDFDRVNNCLESDQFLKNVTLWKSSKALNQSDTFHFQGKKKNYLKGNKYFDKTCGDDGCFATFPQNVKSLYQQFSKEKSTFMFVARDFEFLKAVESKNVASIEKKINELSEIINYFEEESKFKAGMMIIITSSQSVPIEFPKRGRNWNLDSNKRALLYRRPSLMSPVFAKGSQSENFCGIYQSEDIFKRLLWVSKEMVFSLDALEDFAN